LYVKNALHRDSTIQKYFRDSALVTSQKNRFPVSRPDDRAVGVRTRICPLFHPSGRHTIPSGRQTDQASSVQTTCYFCPDPSLHREASVPVFICLDVSAARPDASQYSTKLQILSMFNYGKIDATVRTT
jgi:hypothetical protein